jgi:hypothetical protein
MPICKFGSIPRWTVKTKNPRRLAGDFKFLNGLNLVSLWTGVVVPLRDSLHERN